uniref:Uncharacterized protein n=1 Tax=Arundo donax TaxID=35708 RepID=A0A0A9BQH4_ARUDO
MWVENFIVLVLPDCYLEINCASYIDS